MIIVIKIIIIIISVNEHPVLIDRTKYQQHIFGFVVLVIHIFYNRYNDTSGQISEFAKEKDLGVSGVSGCLSSKEKKAHLGVIL